MELKAYIYKKTIIATGKSYIGKHNGNNPYYKGSGTEWKKDYKAYVINREEDIFEEILEYVEDLTLLNEREKFWLDYFDVQNNSNFYNLTNNNYGPTVCTQEHKDKISIANKDKTKPLNFLQNIMKPVLQYDLNNNFIKEYKSVTEACSELKLHNIGATCRKEYTSCGGFIFRYKTDPLPQDYILPLNKNKNKKREDWVCDKLKVPRPSKQTPIIQYDIEGNYIKNWDSIRQASLQLKINPGGISSCCSGKTKQTNNFIFKFKNQC